MGLADIHIHLLFGVDDGAKDEDEMHAILDAAYQAGTRVLCCTPHFHPGYFGDNYDKVNAAFKRLSSYVQKTYPDMALYLGNELRYEPECVTWLRQGVCRTVNGTRYVLVDFSETAPEKQSEMAFMHCSTQAISPFLPMWSAIDPCTEEFLRFKRSGTMAWCSKQILSPCSAVWPTCSASMPEAVVPWADRSIFLRCTQLYVSPT